MRQCEHFHWLQVPLIYRIHENPKAEKLQRFFEFLTNFGNGEGTGNKVHPRALQEIVESIELDYQRKLSFRQCSYAQCNKRSI